MGMDAALDMCRDALVIALVISAPVLGVGLIFGLLISIIQAVTQIQDQTISIVPKIFAMVITGVFFIPWVTNQLLAYAQELFGAT